MKHQAQKPASETFRLWTLCAALLVSAAILAAVTAAALLRPAAPAAASADGNISDYYTPNEEASQENSESVTANSEIIQNYAPAYTVRAWNGVIAVFERGSDEPVHVVNTPLSRLPEDDRKLLREGISAETLPAALRITEDYE